MAKPRGFDDDSPKDEEIEGIKTKIIDSEKRLAKLIEKRNQHNDDARRLREERDALNAQKKHLVDEMRRLQGERDRLNAEARDFRDKRNEAQRQAKMLLEAKRKMRKEGGAPYAGKVRQLENEIKALQFKQETTSMPVAAENALIDDIKAKMKELESARSQFAEESKILAEVKDVDQKIDELFRAADEAHKLVVAKSNEAQVLHDQIGPILTELKFLDTQSDAKHQAFIKAREDADAVHKEATEMREEVMKARDERSGVFRERRALITDQRQAVRQELFDENKLEEKADEAVKLLLSKGKIRL